jgi:hypothetical protein
MLMQEIELGFVFCWQHVTLYCLGVPLVGRHQALNAGSCGAALSFKVSSRQAQLMLCQLQVIVVQALIYVPGLVVQSTGL